MMLPRALERLARRRTGWPAGVIAWYGPDDRRASKAVASIVGGPGQEGEHLLKWTSETTDLRDDRQVVEAMLAHFLAHGVQRVAVREAIIGCPHEYDGEFCTEPACAYWVGRDRFAGLS